MGRLIFYVVWMVVYAVLALMFPRRRGYYYRRSFYNRDYYQDHTFDHIRMFIRRRRALAKAKRFVKIKRKNKSIILKNSNVILIFDTKFKTFVLYDTKDTKKSATVIWAEQNIKVSNVLDYADEVDTEIEKTFDSICRSFSDISNYLGILQVLKNKFTVVKENNPKEEIQNINPAPKPQSHTQKEKININSLDEKALSKLPGISVILAKKIVNRLNFKGDFLYLQEFYDEMKIKPHFQKKLNELICVKPVEHKKNNDNDDRIIDL